MLVSSKQIINIGKIGDQLNLRSGYRGRGVLGTCFSNIDYLYTGYKQAEKLNENGTFTVNRKDVEEVDESVHLGSHRNSQSLGLVILKRLTSAFNLPGGALLSHGCESTSAKWGQSYGFSCNVKCFYIALFAAWS